MSALNGDKARHNRIKQRSATKRQKMRELRKTLQVAAAPATKAK